MTPQLQQAIKLLQFSNIDLASYLEQELQENPMLERDELLRDEINDDPLDIHDDELVSDEEPEPAALEETAAALAVQMAAIAQLRSW